MEVRCDSMEAIEVVNRFEYKPSTIYSYYNLSGILHKLIREFVEYPIFTNVQGYQDNTIHSLS